MQHEVKKIYIFMLKYDERRPALVSYYLQQLLHPEDFDDEGNEL